MVKIRRGMMKDCKDLLEVYMGTRWFYRTIPGGYKTVEQVKKEHRGVAFTKWGWLVAEYRKRVVGEIVFRTERDPIAGKVGIIRNLDIDVRYQKQGIGTRLTHAAESVLRQKRAGRIVLITPPEAYNYWMKVDYFKRAWLVQVEQTPSKIPSFRSSRVDCIELKDVDILPKSMRFSHTAQPGSLAELVSDVVDRGQPGRLFEFYADDALVGVGGVIKVGQKSAQFVADVTKAGLEYSDLVITRTAKASSRWRVNIVTSIIPNDQLDRYQKAVDWRNELSRSIPVTRIL